VRAVSKLSASEVELLGSEYLALDRQHDLFKAAEVSEALHVVGKPMAGNLTASPWTCCYTD
jgi:hypothetical protein